MTHDFQLEDAIRSALMRDSRIVNDTDVAIQLEGTTVTLRGTVSSFKARHAAIEDARSVRGVAHVSDELRVRLVLDDVRDDELRGVVLQALIWDPRIPAEAIEVKVDSGWITLTGEVKHQSQSDAAFEDVASIEGAGGITNEIRVVTASPTTEP